MATLFLICYGFLFLLKDIFCKKPQEPYSATKPKEEKTTICDFSQEDITYFEELIDLDND